MLKLALFLYVVVLIFIPFVSNIWFLLIPIAITGFAHGLNIPSIQTLLASTASLESRGIVMSLNGMSLRLGQTLGPLIIGLAFTLGGIKSAFFTGSGIALVMLGIASIFIKT